MRAGARLSGRAGADARPGGSRSGGRPAIASIARWHEAAAAGADGRPRMGSGSAQCGARTRASLSRKFRESVQICTRLSECVVPAAASER
ncbi:hypothetical protein OH687_27215 [Burkholderia anthina]|nr:hypothetical protein OH687_27215 [Burkholderia anthina]